MTPPVKQESRPIFEFDCYRTYLRELLKFHRERSGWTLRTLAQFAGMNSPASMSMILSDQRTLSREAAERLGDRLELEPRARLYLVELVRLESARTNEEKAICREKLLALKSHGSRSELSLSQYRVLAVWYYPALYAMAGAESLVFDSPAIASRLGRGITPVMVKQAVGDLLNLNLLRLKDGILYQNQGTVATPDELKNLAAHRYHHTMLGIAQEALELPLEDREFNGLTIAVPINKLTEAKKRIREFRKEMGEFLTSADADSVYQLNIQFFPIVGPKKKQAINV